MFSIFKKPSTTPIDFSSLGTDMHSHLLPGIDDGSPDTDTSIRLIKGLMNLGYNKFIATPHVMHDLHRNTPETIHAAHHQLQQALKAENLDVEVTAAAEYLMDENFDKLLFDKAPLLTLKEDMVLVEFSFVNAPMKVKETIFEMQMNGYRPVLAHPERYAYLRNTRAFFDSLRNAGCLFQLNLLSLTPYYGKSATEIADYLISKDVVDLLGTDLHHDRHLQGLQNYGSGMAKILRLIDRGRLLNPTW